MIRAEAVSVVMGVVGLFALGTGAVNGYEAYQRHNELIKAETTAELLQDQGDPHAAEWQETADTAEDERNHKLVIVGLNLGMTVCFGAGSLLYGLVAAHPTVRRREEERA